MRNPPAPSPQPPAPSPRPPRAARFAVGQGVSFWLGPDGLGQVEAVHRRNVDVLYPRDGRVCRARVSAFALAVWNDTRPLLFACANPLGRGLPARAAARVFEFDGTERMPRQWRRHPRRVASGELRVAGTEGAQR